MQFLHRVKRIFLGLAAVGSTFAIFSLFGEEPAGNLTADIDNGKVLYSRTCVACHGEKAEGKKLFNAPRLAGQEIWYITRQINNFSAGIRGGDTRDIYGMQMRPMSLTLVSEQEVLDVATFISSLGRGTDP